VYLRIVETESGSPRLSRDLIRDRDMRMRLLDSSVGAFAITSRGALFAVASILYWGMHYMVLRSCTSGAEICGRGCCDSSTVIPLLKDRCSAKDLFRKACAVSAL
jgi:hypothetical protein